MTLLHYTIRQQDGTFQPMSCADTTSNRLFILWLHRHDRASQANATKEAASCPRFE